MERGDDAMADQLLCWAVLQFLHSADVCPPETYGITCISPINCAFKEQCMSEMYFKLNSWAQYSDTLITDCFSSGSNDNFFSEQSKIKFSLIMTSQHENCCMLSSISTDLRMSLHVFLSRCNQTYKREKTSQIPPEDHNTLFRRSASSWARGREC